MMNDFDPSELTKEVGLLDVYKASRSKLSRSRINNFSTILVFSALFIYAIFSSETSAQLLEKIRKWAELGFSFSAGILGFLIAGFTIFATVSDKSLFTEMARQPKGNTGLSYLKYNFFALMYVFIVYLSFAILCLLIQLFGGTSGFLSIMLKFMAGDFYFEDVKRVISGFGVIVVGTWFFYCLILLQSFIFNIYHIVMTAIRWQLQNEARTGNRP
jgi:hypothetical protein